MDEQSALAPEAGPEVVTPEVIETEGQTDGQAADAPEGEPEKDSAAKQRRDREKAYKERLRDERDRAIAAQQAAEARAARILDAGKTEKEPVEADYPDPMDYVAAKAIWGAEQRRIQRDAGEAKEAAKAAEDHVKKLEGAEAEIIGRAWVANVAAAKSRYADFDAVALDQSVPVTDNMAQLIQTSDVGPDVLYALGQNKALAAEIAKLSPVEQARAIGRIEASVQAPRPRTETAAPAPISPLRGTGKPALDPAQMSMEDYKKARMSGKLK